MLNVGGGLQINVEERTCLRKRKKKKEGALVILVGLIVSILYESGRWVINGAIPGNL